MTSTINKSALLSWLENNQAKLHPSLEVRESPLGGLGVYATKDLDPETLVYREEIDGDSGEEELAQPLSRTPKTSIFSARNSYISNVLEEHDIHGVLGLITAFIYEYYNLKDESPWFGYFQSFNLKTLDVPPSFWEDKQQKWLKGTEAELLDVVNNEEILTVMDVCVDFAQLMKEELELEIPYVLDINQENEDGDEDVKRLELFAKISVLISSRCFNIDGYHEFALVPAADLFNHSSDLCNCHFESNYEVCGICGMVGCDHMDISDDDEDSEWEEGEELDDEELDGEVSDSEALDGEEANEESHEDEETEDEIKELDDDFIKKFEEEEKAMEAISETEQEQNMPEYLKDHKHDDGAEIYSIDCCDIVLHDNISKGEELYSTYGDLNNPILLLKYQFAELENQNDYVSLGAQVMKNKKSQPKLAGRFKWWREIGRDVFKAWLKQNAAEEGEEDSDEDDEEEEDEEDDDEDSWISDLKINSEGVLSNSVSALVKLCTLKDEEFEKYFQPDPEPKKNKNKKHKASDTGDSQEKYFIKIMSNLGCLMETDEKCQLILKTLISERLDKLMKNELAKMGTEELLKIINNDEQPDRRKVSAAIIVHNELSILQRALENVSEQN
ncbi:protein-lysine N-methyltransferase [Saccharomycopsis crataegensis]|uniref:Protein-lysine N-methyltransferase n=1 Tax=Saccharomycopsis crataegensis TaxID=43959 RepID=A0AAV5QI32_9ASCO|nr:protein-lysine N-methyltransferase [Saccharomycopsis crataegensis]